MANKLQEQNLRNGISIQWGSPAVTLEKGSGYKESYREEIYFNFTVYDNGEVQVRTREDAIIMSRDAFEALVVLFARGTGVSMLISQDGEAGEFIDNEHHLIKMFMNKLLEEGFGLNLLHPVTG